MRQGVFDNDEGSAPKERAEDEREVGFRGAGTRFDQRVVVRRRGDVCDDEINATSARASDGR